MADTLIFGAEMQHLNECYATGGTGVSIDTTTKRTGNAAVRINPSSSQGWFTLKRRIAGGSFGSDYRSIRFYLRIATLPSYGMHFPSLALIVGGGISKCGIDIDGSGHLRATCETLTGSWSTGTLGTGQWYRINLFDNAGTTYVYVNGAEFCSAAVGTPAAGEEIRFGLWSSGFDISADIYFDDIRTDNAQNVLIGAGQAILLPAISDNTDGTWTAGAGGTSLYPAVDNIPPAGLATPTDTSQIKNADKTGSQDALLNCRTYTDGGIGSSDTVNAVMAICNDAEAAATGTKDGGVWISSNPTQTAPGNTFDFGDDLGAMGDFPTNWKTHYGPVTTTPTVTKGSSPVIGVRKTAATTRETHVDFLGVYVDYTPAAAARSWGYIQGA